jgi:hypothetical protein
MPQAPPVLPPAASDALPLPDISLADLDGALEKSSGLTVDRVWVPLTTGAGAATSIANVMLAEPGHMDSVHKVRWVWHGPWGARRVPCGCGQE